MPTYEYECRECGHEFEEYHSMSAIPLSVCPKCGKPALKRLMGSGSGMLFKGTGYYQTDYKKSNGGSPSSTKSPAKTETKPETKPESKSESKESSNSSKPEKKSE